MLYTNTITKGFQSYGQPKSPSSGNKLLVYEDPTYIGFQWRILNTSDVSSNGQGLDLDYYPQGLFLPNEDPDSAYSYLRRTGQFSRAQMIEEFRIGFLSILKEAPWYFVKVSGLADIWKIDVTKSFRGKDKKITFETEEALDLKITYLMDLYRKAVFDPIWMRYALPENQRMFAMELVVGEIRPMLISQPGYQALKQTTYPGFIDDRNLGGAFTTLNSQVDKQAASQTARTTGTFGPGFPEISLVTDVKNILNALKNTKTPANSTYPNINAPWSPATFLSFRFDYCTFDPFSNAPSYLDNVANVPGDRAKNTVVINIPFISEKNEYGLLGALLKDSYYEADYQYDIKSSKESTPRIMQTLGEGADSGVRKQLAAKNQIGNKLLKTLTTAAAAQIENVIERAYGKVSLGNTYGISANTILRRIQGFLNNPIAVATETIGSLGRSSAAIPAALSNVSLSGAEVQLIKDIIGIAVEDGVLTNEDLVQGNLGTTVEDRQLTNEDLVKGNIGVTVEDRILVNGNLVKDNLGKTVEDTILSNDSLVRNDIGTTVEDRQTVNPDLVKGNLGITVEDRILLNGNLVKQIIGTAVEDRVLGNPNLVQGDIGTTVEDRVLGNAGLVQGNIGTAVEDRVRGNSDLVSGNLGTSTEDRVLGNANLSKGNLGKAVEDNILGNAKLTKGNLGTAVEDNILGNAKLAKGNLGTAVEDRVRGNSNLTQGNLGNAIEETGGGLQNVTAGNLVTTLTGPDIVKARLSNVYKQ